MGTLKLRTLFLYGVGLLCLVTEVPILSSIASQDASVPLVILTQDDNEAYGKVLLNTEDFGDLKDCPSEYGLYTTAKPGKNQLQIQAKECASDPISLNLQAGLCYLLFISREDNSNSLSKLNYPKALKHFLYPIKDLPLAKSQPVVAVLYLDGEDSMLEGSIFQGNSPVRKVALPKGKVVALGVGKTGLEVSGEKILFCDPSAEPSVHLFIFWEQKGRFRTVRVVL